MRDLTTVGLSEDRRHVILRSASGEEFRVPVDDRLRATLRNDRARLGQLEIEMDSGLRPRDIQARIRRGESPEEVAEGAQVSIERIMGYAVPVLAEREHIVERARTSTVRRRHSQSGAVTLGDAVDEAICDHDQDPSTAQWDSWRREDGRWTVVVRTGLDDAEQATYVFDAPGRYVTAEDEGSRKLVGDIAPGPDSTDMAIAAAVSDTVPSPDVAVDQPEDEPGVTSLKRARARRALAQEQLTLDPTGADGGDADGSDAGGSDAGGTETDESRAPTVDLSETAEHVRDADPPG